METIYTDVMKCQSTTYKNNTAQAAAD